MSFFKILAYLFAGLFALLLSAVIFFVFVFNWDSLGGYASSKASDASGRKVIIGEGIRVQWGWPHTRISLRNISVDNMDGGTEPHMLDLPMGEIGVDVSELMRFRLAFTHILLDQPNILLEKNAKGQANWDFSKNPEGAATAAAAPDEQSEIPLVDRIQIRDGKLHYIDAKENTDITLTVSNLQGEAKDTKPLRLEGKGTYAKQPMRIDVQGGNLDQLQQQKEPYPLKAALVAGPTSIKVEGTVSDILQLQGLDLHMALAGKNAADLFPLIGVALPPTPPYEVAGKLGYDKSAQRWDFQNFKGKLGDSDLSGNLSWDTAGERPKLTGDFISNKLDMDDLAGLIGGTPSTENGETLSSEQIAQAKAAKESPYLIPDVPLDISRVSAMDADVVFKGQRIINKDVPLDNFLMHIVLDDRLLTAKPVQFGTQEGEIRANITVNARKEPVAITMDTAFRRLSLAKLMDGLAKSLGTENVAKGYIGGRAALTGTGASMREFLSGSDGNLGIGMEGGEFSNLLMELIGLDLGQSLGLFLAKDKAVNVNCIVADFAVKDGQLQSNALVIDTSDTNVTGNGTINFKDEKMQIVLNPQPKDGSILSLKSALHIGGTLKKPSFSIDKGDLALRAGAAVALAIVAPIASVLAFIEPGLGKDSPCYALISNMKDHAGRAKTAPLVPKNPTPAIPENKR